MHAGSRICKTACLFSGAKYHGVSLMGLTSLFKYFNEKMTLFFSPLYTL